MDSNNSLSSGHLSEAAEEGRGLPKPSMRCHRRGLGGTGVDQCVDGDQVQVVTLKNGEGIGKEEGQ